MRTDKMNSFYEQGEVKMVEITRKGNGKIHLCDGEVIDFFAV